MTNDLTSTNSGVPLKGGHGPKVVEGGRWLQISRYKPHLLAYANKSYEIILVEPFIPITNKRHDVRG